METGGVTLAQILDNILKTMAKKQNLRWSGEDILVFLDINRNFEALWDTANENYIKRNAREHGMSKLLQEVTAAGLHVNDGEESLKRKIKNLKDCYRNELNKINRSTKSGAGTDDIYAPKLVWFSKADSFLRNVMAGRESSSNLVSASRSTSVIT